MPGPFGESSTPRIRPRRARRLRTRDRRQRRRRRPRTRDVRDLDLTFNPGTETRSFDLVGAIGDILDLGDPPGVASPASSLGDALGSLGSILSRQMPGTEAPAKTLSDLLGPAIERLNYETPGEVDIPAALRDAVGAAGRFGSYQPPGTQPPLETARDVRNTLDEELPDFDFLKYDEENPNALTSALGALQIGSGGGALHALTRAGRGAVAAQGAKRAATAPIRHPAATAGVVSSPLAFEAPGAAIDDDPGRFKEALEGTGVLAQALGGVAQDVSGAAADVPANALADALSLPAQVLPSLFLTGAALSEAAQGRPDRMNRLTGGFEEESFIPALVSGDFGEAASRAGQHPLYALLEAAGVYGGAGRVAGAAARRGAFGGQARQAATDRSRPPLGVYGDIAIERRPRSRNLITDIAQRRRDQRIAETRGNRATPQQTQRYLNQRLDRTVFAGEQARRGQVNAAEDAMVAVREAAGTPETADIAALAIQRIARNPETALTDLAAYRNNLAAAGQRIATEQGKDWRGKLRANEETIARLDRAIAEPDPEALFAAANRFVEEQNPLQRGLHERGLYGPEQTERASAVGFLREHEGAGYGTPPAPIQRAERSLQEARAADAGGFRESAQTARRRLGIAETGLIQAERTFATMQARSRAGAEARKTEKGQQRQAVRLQQARNTVVAARERVNQARREVRETEAALTGEQRSLRRTVGEREAALSQARRAPDQILTREGEPFTTDAIRAALANQGAQAPGFVSNQPGTLGRGAYYRPSTDRPSGTGKRSTGEAVAQGTSDTSFEALTQQLVGQSSRLQQAKNFDTVSREYGFREPGGDLPTFANSADGFAAITELEMAGALPDIPGGWTVRRLAPWPTRNVEQTAARAHANDVAPEARLAAEEGFMEATVRNAYPDESAPPLTGDGPTIIFPRAVAARERQHFAERTPEEKTAEAATGMFKGAILPTSPGWLAGNIADIYGIRTVVAGVTPGDIRAGRGLGPLFEKALSPDQQVRVMESLVPGGVYGHVRRVQPHRAYEQFVGTSLEPIWRAATTLRNAPVGKNIGDLYRRYRDGVFRLENEFIERTPQYGALSKLARQELNMTRRQFRKAIEAQEPVLMDFIRGFRNQDRVDRFARQIEDIYGNWGKNGPAARRFLTTWAPFWMWARAATKFAFVTLPRDHPVLSSVLAASEEMTREERQKLGLDFEGERSLEDFAQGSIPIGDSEILRISNLTTFGAFADYPDFMSSMAAPQFMSALLAGTGLDWKGDRLTDPDGRPASGPQKMLAAALSTGEGYIPFFNVIQQVVDRGFEGAAPARKFDAGTTDFLRDLSESRQINVPVTDSEEEDPLFRDLFEDEQEDDPLFDDLFEEESAESSSSDLFDNLFD